MNYHWRFSLVVVVVLPLNERHPSQSSYRTGDQIQFFKCCICPYIHTLLGHVLTFMLSLSWEIQHNTSATQSVQNIT